MSLVIPAAQLSRTIITVRCNTPHSAPQIECSLDEYAPSSSSSHSADNQTMLLDVPPPFLDASSFIPSHIPSNSDLSVERGFDHRGHYVRFGFQPSSSTPSIYDNRIAKTEPDTGAQQHNVFMHESTPRPPTQQSQYTMTSQSPSPPINGSTGHSEISSILPPNAVPIASGPVSSCHPSAYPDNSASFTCPPESEFMSALEYISMFENASQQPTQTPDYPLFSQLPSDNMVPSNFYSALPDPVTPGETCSSSSSSCMSSPTTPFDMYLPGSNPTLDGACTPGMMSGFSGHNSSPIMSNMVPAQTSRTSGPGKSSESRLLPCPQPGCKRQFKSTSTLGGHMKTHAGKGTRFSCGFPPCMEKFSRRHDQLRHEVYKHGKQCEWVCPKCNSFFSYERSLEKHTCTMDKSRRGSVPSST